MTPALNPLIRDRQITHGFGTVDASAKNERSIRLRKKIIMVVLLSLMAGPVMAQESKVVAHISF